MAEGKITVFDDYEETSSLHRSKGLVTVFFYLACLESSLSSGPQVRVIDTVPMGKGYNSGESIYYLKQMKAATHFR